MPITYLTQWKIVGNSEVHTLPYPDGILLPQGYKRCEYLTFDGSSYINTRVKTANDIGYNLSIFTENPSGLVIGARKTTQGQVAMSNFVLGALYDTKISCGYGGASQVVNFSNSYAYGVKHNIVFNDTTFKIDNDIINIDRTAGTDFYNIYIGTWNNAGSPDPRCLVGSIYDTIIYNTQGELWHGIPCLDANDIPCFYDMVSQTAFYNQGSGIFTYKLYPQPTEIWSCGEYNPIDGKYHILVQPLGGSIADIALTEPLRKVNGVADTIEFPSETEGKALVTRNLESVDLGTITPSAMDTNTTNKRRFSFSINNIKVESSTKEGNILCATLTTRSSDHTYNCTNNTIAISSIPSIMIYKEDYANKSAQEVQAAVDGVIAIYELVTPTTELVDAPQIEEADSYSMVINQGGKAVSWSSFETE